MNADVSLLGFGAIAMRKDDEPWLVGSPDLLRAELGWQPSIGLDEGVRAAVAGASPEPIVGLVRRRSCV